MPSEVISRPVLRQCPHPEASKSKVEKAWRVWSGRFVLGTVYQKHPKGPWYAMSPSGSVVDQKGDQKSFPTSQSAVQYLQGFFDLHKPKKPEEEPLSPFLKYPQDDDGYFEIPPTE